MLKIIPKFAQKIYILPFSLHYSGDKKTVLLMMLFLFCSVSCQLTPTRSQSKREIGKNDLPLVLRWSKSIPPFNGTSSFDNLACYQDVGVFRLYNYNLDSKWRGLVVFDQDGNVLWNKPEHRPFATFLGHGNVIIFDVPRLYAYDVHTGKLLWETQDGLSSRLGGLEIYQIDDTRLAFSSFKRFNEYQLEDGFLLSQESFPTQDFLLRHEGIDVYGTHNYLEATAAGERENKVWHLTPGNWQRPVKHEENFIVPFAGRSREFCSVSLNNGQLNWCNDTLLASNIAVKEGVGFGITNNDELFAFDLSNGEEIGRVIFSPPTTNDTHDVYRIAVCENHMLVYMTSPEQLFWFDFVANDE